MLSQIFHVLRCSLTRRIELDAIGLPSYKNKPLWLLSERKPEAMVIVLITTVVSGKVLWDDDRVFVWPIHILPTVFIS